MKVETFFNPICEENVHVVSDDNNDCFIVDAGDLYMTKVINYIKENNLNLLGIMTTHGHFDHTVGIEKVMAFKKVPVYISEQDKEFLYNSNLSLSYWINKDFVLSADVEVITLKENDIVFGFKVLETPGHTRGAVCYYNEKEKLIFTGDTIIKGTYGRVDFPTGNLFQMRSTIRRLMTLPDDTIMHSGHGEVTTIGNEKILYKYF